MNMRIFYRRCQHCDATHNHEDELLIECEICGKELLPLYYSQLPQEVPVIGLTADWDKEPETSK